MEGHTETIEPTSCALIVTQAYRTPAPVTSPSHCSLTGMFSSPTRANIASTCSLNHLHLFPLFPPTAVRSQLRGARAFEDKRQELTQLPLVSHFLKLYRNRNHGCSSFSQQAVSIQPSERGKSPNFILMFVCVGGAGGG